MTFSRPPLLCLLLIVAVAHDGSAWAEEGAAAFAMTADEFRRLSPEEQAAVLAGALGRRLEHARDLYYEAVTTGANHEYHDGEVGEIAVALNGSRLRHWTLGDAFRMDTIRGGDVSVKPMPVETVASNFDHGEGVGVSTVHFSDTDRCFGRIDSVPDSIVESNRYASWLDGEQNTMQNFFIKYIFDHIDESTIDVPGGGETVFLTVPWEPFWSDRVVGEYEFELNPRKGFLPIRGGVRWEVDLPKGKSLRKHERFFVEGSRLVGDVYMPTVFREVTTSSRLGEALATVWRTEVSEIEAGSVTPEDFVVPLIEGMEVIDAIRGVTFRVGPDGEPAGDGKPMRSENPS